MKETLHYIHEHKHKESDTGEYWEKNE